VVDACRQRLTLIALIAYACTTKKMWKEMTTQNELTRQSIRDNEAAQAARLIVKKFDVAILPKEYFTARATYSISNVGHSMATNISV
jgi:hypothetical protein